MSVVVGGQLVDLDTQLNTVAEPLVIPIDEKTGSPRVLGDPTFSSGTKFRTQRDVDDALAGATAFRFVMDVLDSLAGQFSEHDITLDFTGITDNQFGRTGDTSVAYDFSRTQFIGTATWLVDFPASSSWPLAPGSFSGVTITTHQDGSQDPFVNFNVGEGIPNDRSLEALFIRLSTGQLLTIHDHTDTQIRVNEEITDTIVDGVTTFDVIEPFGLLNIDAADGVSPLVTGFSADFCVYDRGPMSIQRNTVLDQAEFRNVRFDGGEFDPIHHIIRSGIRFENCLFDRRAGGGAPNGRALDRGFVFLTRCCVKQESATLGSQAFDTAAQIGTKPGTGISTTNCVIQGGNDATLSYFGGEGSHNNTVFIGGGNSSGNGPPSCIFVNSPKSTFILFFSFGNGIPCTIRDPVGATTPGLRIQDSRVSPIFIGLTIANCPGPCVQLDQGADYVEDGETLFPGILDGGGNGDVGFLVAGLGAKLSLQSGGGTTVTGTNGDVQVGSATPVTFASLTASPITDFQLLSRAQRP